MFWLEIPLLVTTNMAGYRPDVSFKLFGIVTLPNSGTPRVPRQMYICWCHT